MTVVLIDTIARLTSDEAAVAKLVIVDTVRTSSGLYDE